jgi:hypothetical protein
VAPIVLIRSDAIGWLVGCTCYWVMVMITTVQNSAHTHTC